MEKKLQRKLLRLTAWVLTAVILVSILIFFTTVQSILLDNMERANQNLVDQVNASFEMVMEQATDQIHKLSLYENDLLDAVEDRRIVVSRARELYMMLDSIVMSNRYFFSAYLYSPTDDCFFTSEWGSAHIRENFYDKAVLPAVESGLVSNVNPRVIETPGKIEKLLFSIVVSIPLSGVNERPQCILVVNVDAGKLYSDILKKNNATEHTRLYLLDRENNIIIGNDNSLIGKPITDIERQSDRVSPFTLPLNILLSRPLALESTSFSSQLDWTFCLWNSVQFDTKYIKGQYGALFGAVGLFAGLVLICSLMIRRSTRPLHAVIRAYSVKLLRDILLGSSGQQELAAQLTEMNQSFAFSRFTVAYLEITGSHRELSVLVGDIRQLIPDLPQWGDVRIADIKPGTLAVVFNYSDAKQEAFVRSWIEATLRLICKPFDPCAPRLFMTVSSSKDGLDSLVLLAQECERMLQYKLSMQSHQLLFDQFKITGNDLEYPAQQEKQLINNLMVGNGDGCVHYLSRFFEELFAGGYVTDAQLVNQIYQLQNNILKTISSLPISIHLNHEISFVDCYDRRQLESMLQDFIQGILEEMNKKDSQNDNLLLTNIFTYIEENLTDNNFNLNSLSYQFNLNRNYLAKLIREHTGQTFNDLVNRKKIDKAKELLADRSLTIESIARQCGFSYTHYFIKIFKGFEGVTPGQYREMQTDNKNA